MSNLVEARRSEADVGGSGARARVIDFRARANTPETQQYIAPRIAEIRALGLMPVDGDDWYDAPVESVDEFVDRLDRIGIDAAVFVGRNRSGANADWALTNEWVADVMKAHPGRILGIAGVDATRLEGAREELLRDIGELGLLGANVDPFQLDAAADDPRFDVVYETCLELSVPVILTFGAMPGISADLRCWPLALDRVARRYPSLTVVACHGAWPFLTEMIAAAWRNPNLYFDNSFYHFAPGAEVIVDAANKMIGDKILYGSAYPFRPLQETLTGVMGLGFSEEVRRKVLHDNAARILGLDRAA